MWCPLYLSLVINVVIMCDYCGIGLWWRVVNGSGNGVCGLSRGGSQRGGSL